MAPNDGSGPGSLTTKENPYHETAPKPVEDRDSSADYRRYSEYVEDINELKEINEKQERRESNNNAPTVTPVEVNKELGAPVNAPVYIDDNSEKKTNGVGSIDDPTPIAPPAREASN